MFLKEKQNSKIKRRSCAGGRPQPKVFTKAEVTSPTVATESLFITAIIDAYKNCDVATVNLPGAFMHTDTDPKDKMFAWSCATSYAK